jgi:peptidoglycan/LPS O-acetylase OafA/YrhL
MSEAKPRKRPNWLVLLGIAIIFVAPVFLPRAWHFSWLPPEFAHRGPVYPFWLVGSTLVLIFYHRQTRDWMRTIAILAGGASYAVHSHIVPPLIVMKHPAASTVDDLSICVLIPAILLFIIRETKWN